MKEKVINDSKQLAHQRLKAFFDTVFMIGIFFILVKITVFVLNKTTSLDLSLFGGSFLWNFGPLIIMVGAAIGVDVVKDKYIED